MATSTSLNNSAAISQYWEKKALSKLEAETHLYKMAWKKTLPNQTGKVINFVRFNLASADTSPSVEGAVVAPETLGSNTITASLQQYVAAVAFSDILDETSFVEGGMEEIAAEYITQKLKYTIDALLRAEITSTTTTFGTNLFAGNSAASIGAITSSDTLRAADLRRVRGRLANNNVPKFNNEKYVGVLHTASEYDIRAETNAGAFLTLNQYTESGVKDIKSGLVGDIFGLSLYSSSLNASGADGNNTTVYYSYFFGDESLAAAELNSQRMKVIRKQGGDSKNTYDPTNAIGGVVAYKSMFAAKNLTGTNEDPRVLRVGAASGL